MKSGRISLFQVTGPDRVGKSTFLTKLGLKSHHFPKPLQHKTPVGTLHAMATVMAEYERYQWKAVFAVWDRGLIDPFVYDVTRGGHFSEALFKSCYDISEELLENQRQVFFVGTEPITVEAKDADDIYYRQMADQIRDRFQYAAAKLRSWGAEVYTFRNFAESVPAVLFRDLCRKGQVAGEQTINADGTITVK